MTLRGNAEVRGPSPRSGPRLPGGRQPLQEKPKGYRQLEEEDGGVTGRDRDAEQLGKKDEGVGADSHQRRREHTEASQGSRYVAGPKPQVAEERGAKPEEKQAELISCVVRTDRQSCQSVQPIGFEGLQVTSTAQEPQDVEVIQRSNAEGSGLEQPPRRDWGPPA